MQSPGSNHLLYAAAGATLPEVRRAANKKDARAVQLSVTVQFPK